jgi:ferrous iron transport protein A
MPLLLLKAGQKRKIIKILGNDKTSRKIQEMGLIEGEDIEILSFLSGDIIVLVKESKIALSRQIASKIHVCS